MRFQKEPTHLLTGHKGPVTKARFSPDGLHLLSCSHDRKLILWNPYKNIKIQEFEGLNREIRDVSIAGDKSHFCSAGGDKNLYIWNVSKTKVVNKFIGHSAGVNCCEYINHDTILVSGGQDTRVNLWDNRMRGHCMQSLGEASDSISCINFAEDRHELTTGSVDGNMRVYDFRKGMLYQASFNKPITSIAYSKNHDVVCASLLGDSIRLLDAKYQVVNKGGMTVKKRFIQLNSYSGYDNSLYKLNCLLNPSDELVVSGTESGEVKAWSLDCENPIGHTDFVEPLSLRCPIYHTEFSPPPLINEFKKHIIRAKDRAFVTCGHDKVIRVYLEDKGE